MAKQSLLQRPPRRMPHRKTKRQFVMRLARSTGMLLAATFLTSCGLLAYGLLFLPVFQVQGIEIRGARDLNNDQLLATVHQSFPREIVSLTLTSIVTADLREVEARLRDEFPGVRRVTAEREFLNMLAVNIEERTPLGVWCSHEQACYILDRDGVIFRILDGQGTNAGVRIIGSNVENPQLGDQVVETELIEIIASASKVLEDVFPDDTLAAREAYIRSAARLDIATSEGWHVYINPQENPEWQIEKLQAALGREIPFSERQQLEYIDLRFGDQVYYR